MTQDVVMSQDDSSASSSPLPFKVTATYPGPRLSATCTSLAYSSPLTCLFIGSCNSGVTLLPLPPTSSTPDADLTSSPCVISFSTETSQLTNSGTTHLLTSTFGPTSTPHLSIYTSSHRLHILSISHDSDTSDYAIKRVHCGSDTLGPSVAKDTTFADDENRLLKLNVCEVGLSVPSSKAVLGVVYKGGKFEEVEVEKEGGR